MKIFSVVKDTRLTLFLRGELDHHEAREAVKKIDMLIDDLMPRDCVLDMSGLNFMDSSGIALILKVSKRMSELGGRAWVENAARQPLRVIDASGIDRLVRIR